MSQISFSDSDETNLSDDGFTTTLSTRTPSVASSRRRQRGRRPSSSRGGGTSATSSTYGIAGSFIVCLCTGRGLSQEIGMTAINLTSSQCFVYQYVDLPTFSRTFHKLQMLDPIEIVIPSTFSYPHKSKLYALLEENFSYARIIPFPRQSFNDSFGQMLLNQLCVKEELNSILHLLSSKYFALSSIAALIKYVETVGKIRFTKQSIIFNYNALEGTMLIDTTSMKNLELVKNLNSDTSKECLFSTLNYTCTPMGARFLRTNILQPLCDKETIELRQGAIEELNNNDYVHMSLVDGLKGYLDIDRIISSIIQLPTKTSVKAAEQLVNNVIAIKFILKQLPLILEPLSYSENDLIQAIASNIYNEDLKNLAETIDEVINDDITYQRTPLGLRNQRCYAVRANHSELLDIARQTYKETTDDAYELVGSYASQFDLPMKISYNTNRNFHIVLHQDQITQDLPSEFINISRKKKNVTFTTLQLMSINDRIQESLTEIILMSNKIITSLTEHIRSTIYSFYKLSEAISLLDLLLTFSRLCKTYNLCKPSFSENILCINEAVHPIKSNLGKLKYVENNIHADETCNVQIITGPNMSGKSTYLREVALLTIMAQMGCFIPAKSAMFRIQKSIFARIGSDNTSEANVSSFALEMQQTAALLDNLTDESIVIIDELGRGTSSSDGMTIAFSIIEQLVASRSISFVATHFLEVASSLRIYSNVICKTLTVGEDDNYTYQLSSGICENDGYGIRLAEKAGYPSSMINFARTIAKDVDNIKTKQETINTMIEEGKDIRGIILRQSGISQRIHNVIGKRLYNLPGGENDDQIAPSDGPTHVLLTMGDQTLLRELDAALVEPKQRKAEP